MIGHGRLRGRVLLVRVRISNVPPQMAVFCLYSSQLLVSSLLFYHEHSYINGSVDLREIVGPLCHTLYAKLCHICCREFHGKTSWVGHALLDLRRIREQKQIAGWHNIDMSPYATTFLAAGGADGRVRILNVRTGAETALPLDQHTDAVSKLSFHTVASSDYLVTAAMDGTVLLWNTNFLDAATRTAVGTNQVSAPLARRRPMKKFQIGPPTAAVSSVAVLEMFGSLRVVAGCHDAAAWMWSLDTSHIVAKETWLVLVNLILFSNLLTLFGKDSKQLKWLDILNPILVANLITSSL